MSCQPSWRDQGKLMLPKLGFDLLPNGPDPAVEVLKPAIQLNNGRCVTVRAHATATQTLTTDQIMGSSSDQEISISDALLILGIRYTDTTQILSIESMISEHDQI